MIVMAHNSFSVGCTYLLYLLRLSFLSTIGILILIFFLDIVGCVKLSIQAQLSFSNKAILRQIRRQKPNVIRHLYLQLLLNYGDTMLTKNLSYCLKKFSYLMRSHLFCEIMRLINGSFIEMEILL